MKAKNAIDFSVVRDLNKSYKDGSLFRVISFLNDNPKFLTLCGLEVPKKGKCNVVTIDLLKEVLPTYFTVNVTDKKTKEVSAVNRSLFNPYPFLCAMRKKYGIQVEK